MKPSFVAYADVHAPLAQVVVETTSEGVQDPWQQMAARRDRFLYEGFRDAARSKYVHDVIALDAMRTRVLTPGQGVGKPVHGDKRAQWCRTLDEKNWSLPCR